MGAVPAELEPVDGVHDGDDSVDEPAPATLSPSRAGDFLSCPRLYRYRHVDRLPEPLSLDALRGTVVHRALELLYDLPAEQRTVDRAAELVDRAWADVHESEPELAERIAAGPLTDDDARAAWLETCLVVARRYFTLEDPRLLEPGERELYVEAPLASGLVVRGIVDRVDVADDGALRVVDYKTGRAPGVGFEARALFQLRIYALALWRTRGVVPRALRLVYLGDGQLVGYEPDADDLLATERKVDAVWAAIGEATSTGDWQPSPGRLCGWCAHKSICPAWSPQPEARNEPAAWVGEGRASPPGEPANPERAGRDPVSRPPSGGH